MLPTQQHTPPTAATKATPVLTNALRYLMPVPVYLFIYFFAKGLTLYAFVVCFGRLPQGAQQCFEKSLGEWALLTRYDQCAGKCREGRVEINLRDIRRPAASNDEP